VSDALNSRSWHIRDWGRGLRCEHLTQNENKEKLAHPDQVVGKFGVGLKDALATFDRHRVAVVIRSRYSDIRQPAVRRHAAVPADKRGRGHHRAAEHRQLASRRHRISRRETAGQRPAPRPFPQESPQAGTPVSGLHQQRQADKKAQGAPGTGAD
jgi:hypothetical protein